MEATISGWMGSMKINEVCCPFDGNTSFHPLVTQRGPVCRTPVSVSLCLILPLPPRTWVLLHSEARLFGALSSTLFWHTSPEGCGRSPSRSEPRSFVCSWLW